MYGNIIQLLTYSLGSLLQHARKCWGQETVDRVMAMDNKTANDELRQELKKEKRGEQSRLTLLYKPLKKSWDKICSTLHPSKESIRYVDWYRMYWIDWEKGIDLARHECVQKRVVHLIPFRVAAINGSSAKANQTDMYPLASRFPKMSRHCIQKQNKD